MHSLLSQTALRDENHTIRVIPALVHYRPDKRIESTVLLGPLSDRKLIRGNHQRSPNKRSGNFRWSAARDQIFQQTEIWGTWADRTGEGRLQCSILEGEG
ncbi:hypothetical protein PoB_006908700 [Plakobranchus ocellatus]|uniref:Uncharacterized protein n=1 Tax=Plakobranchus ocellatus TaxID=259542 RepID=A0AAV4DEC0_9GAST|nr:hypothetical protein PoB_006908700 [Plakobranchus ocellatus]